MTAVPLTDGQECPSYFQAVSRLHASAAMAAPFCDLFGIKA